MKPHDTWADVYDFAYEQEFKAFYTRLTQSTLATVRSRVRPGSSIVDFGAGTGRLAIPLAREGYKVTAVEPSAPMLARLHAGADSLAIEQVCTSMQEFRRGTAFDLALCVFSVLNYLLDHESLASALSNAVDCLRPEGALILDVADRGLFGNRNFNGARLQRHVTVRAIDPAVHEYTESITLSGDPPRHYQDRFLIRHWTVDEVLDAAARCGLGVAQELSEELPGAGARYFLLRPTPGR
ncbi:MAG: class I SAM-dependent methyltransferase [Pseudomonadota bacterium]|jgi:SAM-dependent methyltransferase